MRKLVALAVLGMGLGTLAAPWAVADFPGNNGRITFMKTDDAGFWQIWVASRDLSSQKKVTSGSADSGWAVWAPGGSRIALDSDRADPDPSDSTAINDVFTMRPDSDSPAASSASSRERKTSERAIFPSRTVTIVVVTSSTGTPPSLLMPVNVQSTRTRSRSMLCTCSSLPSHRSQVSSMLARQSRYPRPPSATPPSSWSTIDTNS